MWGMKGGASLKKTGTKKSGAKFLLYAPAAKPSNCAKNGKYANVQKFTEHPVKQARFAKNGGGVTLVAKRTRLWKYGKTRPGQDHLIGYANIKRARHLFQSFVGYEPYDTQKYECTFGFAAEGFVGTEAALISCVVKQN